MVELPNFDELPRTSEGVPSGWGVFGAEDNIGLVNLLTPERVLSASRLIKGGAVFSLNVPIDAFTPPIAIRRGSPRHTILHRSGALFFDDLVDNFYLQASSQWDSLAHAGYGPDAFYNGATEAQILAGKRNTIDHWARLGICGRAVLLDMVRARENAGRPYDPGTSTGFDVADLELAREQAGVDLQPGDIVLLYTGYIEWYQRQPEDIRLEIPGHTTTAGLAHTEEVCRYLWNHHIAAIAGDNFAVEVWPPDRGPGSDQFGSLHRILIGQFGMALGELFWLKDLADDCARDGVYEFFFAASPLNVPGGIGSTANALAIK
jgi:kynurenine formamidase